MDKEDRCSNCGALQNKKSNKIGECWKCGETLEELEDIQVDDKVVQASDHNGRNILCTKCNATIQVEEAEISKSFIKCPNCNYWEEYKVEILDEPEKCPNCDSLQDSDSIYCSNCGQQIQQDAIIKIMYCEKCGSEYDLSNKYCKKDGTMLVIKEVTATDIAPPLINEQKPSIKKPWLGFWYVYLYATLMVLGAIASLIMLIVLDSSLAQDLGINKILAYSIAFSAIVSIGLVVRSKTALIITLISLFLGVGGWLVYMAEPNYSIGQNSSGLGLTVFWIIYFIKNRAQFYRR